VLFVFGFRAMPGIVVLPIWIAWEVLQYLTDTGSSVNYMAHAGGLIGGAVLGMAVTKRLSAGRRVEEFHRQREQEAFDRAEYERAQALVAKLDFEGANSVFARLAERFPHEIELLKQWYAIAKADPADEHFHRVVSRILTLPKADGALRDFQRAVFVEYFEKAKPAGKLEPRVLARIGVEFAQMGMLAERAADVLFRQAPQEPRLAALWSALAQAFSQRSGDAASLAKTKRYRALLSAQAKVRGAGPV
jgi:predicted Zn-dependent protease